MRGGGCANICGGGCGGGHGCEGGYFVRDRECSCMYSSSCAQLCKLTWNLHAHTTHTHITPAGPSIEVRNFTRTPPPPPTSKSDSPPSPPSPPLSCSSSHFLPVISSPPSPLTPHAAGVTATIPPTTDAPATTFALCCFCCSPYSSTRFTSLCSALLRWTT